MSAAQDPAPVRRVPWTRIRHGLARIGLSGRALVILPPALWLAVFFLVPLAVVLKISLSEAAIARPPYLPLLTVDPDGTVQLTLHLSNFLFLFQDSLYVNAYLNSIRIAFITTALALLVGYPIAYVIARATDRWRNVLLMLIILPFWSSFLLRVYAWIGFMKGNGVINNTLDALGFQHLIGWFNGLSAALGLGWVVPPLPFIMLQTDFAVYVGIVYTYLPFMILPLYTNLVKLDPTLLEAAADLGARPFRTFLTVTLPLSVPGIVAGSLLVFIPAIGEYVIPALLGGPDTLMIGRVLWDEFFANRDWPVASAVAIAMLIVVVGPIMLVQNAQSALVERR